MRVHQVRYGLATNSSSSHSVIVLGEGETLLGHMEDLGGQFGWENFTLVSEDAKRMYVAAQIVASKRSWKEDNTKLYMQVIEATGVSEEDFLEHSEPSVDHESVWGGWPEEWCAIGPSIDVKFVQQFVDYFLREDIVVLGGNDNSDGHPDSGTGTEADLPGLYGGIARDDGTHWTLFNPSSGKKTRMSFDNDAPAPVKGKTPELLDVKITDYCTFGCENCYQDSTEAGQHAKMSDLTALADSCAENKVFEVALGGGETTLHPNFLEVLKMFRARNVVPNFTTRNKQVFSKKDKWVEVRKQCGAFAFSIDGLEDMRYVLDKIAANEFNNNKITVQLVMGAVDIAEFEKIMKLANSLPWHQKIRVTLLDYKTDGRGANVTPYDYSTWIEVWQRVGREVNLGIDTPLAAKFEKQLNDVGVSETLYETREGGFSMYVDAVANKAGRASYASSLTMRPMDMSNATASMNEIFHSF